MCADGHMTSAQVAGLQGQLQAAVAAQQEAERSAAVAASAVAVGQARPRAAAIAQVCTSLYAVFDGLPAGPCAPLCGVCSLVLVVAAGVTCLHDPLVLSAACQVLITQGQQAHRAALHAGRAGGHALHHPPGPRRTPPIPAASGA